MLFRLVQPVKRSGSSKGQFQKRIPGDLRDRIAGRKLVVPIGSEFVSMTVSAKVVSIRFSRRTGDPTEIEIRHAEALAYLEGIFRSLRENRPLKPTRAQAASLSGDFYRNWAEAEKRSLTIVVEVDENGARVVDELDEAETEAFESAAGRFRHPNDRGAAAEIGSRDRRHGSSTRASRLPLLQRSPRRAISRLGPCEADTYGNRRAQGGRKVLTHQRTGGRKQRPSGKDPAST